VPSGHSAFSFRFTILLHKDDAPMLTYIKNRVNIGKVRIGVLPLARALLYL